MADILASLRPVVAELDDHPLGRCRNDVARAFGISKDVIVELGLNENPYGPSPRVAEALARHVMDLRYYPGGFYRQLREAIAASNGVKPSEVEIGPGAEAIIRYLASLFIDPGDESVVARWTFDAPPWWTVAYGGRVAYVDLINGRYDLDAMLRASTKRTKMIWLCSPNNPTGSVLRQAQIGAFLRGIPTTTAVVFDQAYQEYVDDSEYGDGLNFLKSGHENVIVLRTFSKAYGLAGARLGYVIGTAGLIAKMQRVHEPFHVSHGAAVAGLAALEDQDWLSMVVENTRRERQRLTKGLAALGLHVLPSQANFVLAKVPCSAETLAESLLRAGVIVRPATKSGYPDCMRITVGTSEQNSRALEVLRDALGQREHHA